MLADLNNSGSMPALEQMLRFAGARQRLLAHNIANIDTPNFIPLDVSPTRFAAELRDALDRRSESAGSNLQGRQVSPLQPAYSEVKVAENGEWTLDPQTASGNILYHDRNNRDLERMMQALAENQLAYRTAADLFKRENDILRSAISGRV
jgi:flagellar basal-body rod protein FlgB